MGWGNNNININRNINVNNINNRWQHNPLHRQGVKYTNANVHQRFGNKSISGGVKDRMNFRGHDGHQVLNPGTHRPGTGNRPNIGNRPNAGNRPSIGNRPGNRPDAHRPSANRPANRPHNRPAANRPHNNAFGNIGPGRTAHMHSNRGHASMGARRGGGGGFHGGGGGGLRGGGGGFHRSDIRLKHDIALLGRLDNGLGFYRFSYTGGHTAYVGVMAQEVKTVMPAAVTRGADGYLRVHYGKLGLAFETYDRWLAEGAHVPSGVTRRPL
jgi:hypothetical protein